MNSTGVNSTIDWSHWTVTTTTPASAPSFAGNYGINNTFLVLIQPSKTEGWRESIDTIEQMEWIGDEWDGEGSYGPSSQIIATAIRLANHLLEKKGTPPSRVAPGVSGTIVMEWQYSGQLWQLEINGPTTVEFYHFTPGRESVWEEIDISWLLDPSEPSTVYRSRVQYELDKVPSFV